jgi:uroporphyrinogen-III synthase
LVAVRSAPADPFEDLPGWSVGTVVVGRQEDVDLSDEVLFHALERNQAVAITSPRAARWLASRDIPAHLLRPVLVAGPATGALIPHRWTRLVPESTGGAAVARLALEHGHVLLLYLGAQETAGTLEGQAKSLGVIVEHVAIYRTAGVEDLSQSDRDALDSSRAFAFLAPSAVRFLAEADVHRFEYLSRRAVAVAAGEATREQLRELGWRDVRASVGSKLQEIVQALEAA